MSELQPYICENVECEVAQKKVCVEGLDLAKCPHFGKPPKEEEGQSAHQLVGEGLPLGKKLTVDEASDLLGAARSRLIAMIGPSEAGKTSLIASLYDLFQMGPVANAAFRGSRTLFEFEETCHDARAASRGIPHKSRTPRGQVQFYHLDVVPQTGSAPLTLALADRGGEEYQDAMDDIGKANEFVEIRRADTICMLIDGARLLDSGARHNLKFEISQILVALQEGGTLSRKPKLALILTKLDVVRGANFEARVLSDFAEIETNITGEHSEHFSEISCFQVAASPTEGAVPRGTGVPDVLMFWLAETERRIPEKIVAPLSQRMFGRFGSYDHGAEIDS